MIKFLLNHAVHVITDWDPKTTLLDYLREHLRLSGTKEGCATGDCGACTVVIGEAEGSEIHYQAVNSCTTLIGKLHGRQLITPEGLSSRHDLHAVQQALVDCHGSQCGFCIPGMVMSLFAYRKTYQEPERETAVRAIEGNLCRCTGYRPIIDAAIKSFELPSEDQFSESEAATVVQLNAINHENPSAELSAGGVSYFSPRSIDELSRLLLQYPGAGLMAGGTDLCLEITQSLRDFDVLVSVERVGQLGKISHNGEFLEIGAAVTFSKARTDLVNLYPHLAGLIDRLGSLQVRNVGTLAGNIANASGTGDMATALIAMNASLRLRRGNENRSILVENFIVGYKSTALRPSEFIEQIVVPVPARQDLFRVYKVSKRSAVDISSVCGAFNLSLDQSVIRSAVVAFAGMGEAPKRALHCEQALLGQEFDESTIESAIKQLALDFSPISDVRATAGYRLEISGNLLRRLFIEHVCDSGQAEELHFV